MPHYAGYVALNGTLTSVIVTKGATNNAVNADALPTYRIYGENGKGTGLGGFLKNGTMALKDTNTITGATNANPIVITSAGHGLSTGVVVTITGVGGNTNANGTFVVTVVDANTFSVPATGNGAYTSGGVWNVSGLYGISQAVNGSDGFESGKSYVLLASYAISATQYTDVISFTVV